MLPQALEHLGQTGVVAIDDGRAAFGARVALLRTAARSVDIQTFIWRADNAGTLLFEEVVRAAERGVRVRLLLDDLNTAGTDPTLALLASHANSELRLYNPFVGRGSRAIGLLADFTRLNHRMHNKSFTVDNVVTLVGGRNIADEYYEIGETGLVDLDIVAVGAVVQAVSNEFDLFWNSASAYPARSLIADVTPQTRDALAQRAQAIRAGSQATQYTDAVLRDNIVQGLASGRIKFEWTLADVVFDDPAKTLASGDHTELQLLPKLHARLGEAFVSVDLISPYFVPGEAGTETLIGLTQRGVRVRVLTNSLSATDEKSVHAGYLKRREALLRAGVQLYELKRDASVIVQRARDLGRGSKGRPAREDLHHRWPLHLRRLVQPRPALLAPEHRDGTADRQRCDRRPVVVRARSRVSSAGLPRDDARRRHDPVGRRRGHAVRHRPRNRLGRARDRAHRLVAADRVAVVALRCLARP